MIFTSSFVPGILGAFQITVKKTATIIYSRFRISFVLRYLVGSVAAINVLTSIGEIHTQIYSVAKIYPNFNLVISFASNLLHFLSFKMSNKF